MRPAIVGAAAGVVCLVGLMIVGYIGSVVGGAL